MLAPETRAGETPEASLLELPAAKNSFSPIISLIARCKRTDGEVYTKADTAGDSTIDDRAGRSGNGEVDNGGLARGDSMVHSEVDPAYNVADTANVFVGKHFNGKDRGTCGWPETTRNLVKTPIEGDAVFGLHSGSDASSMGTMAISISVRITTEGGKPCCTSGEGGMIDVDSSIDT